MKKCFIFAMISLVALAVVLSGCEQMAGQASSTLSFKGCRGAGNAVCTEKVGGTNSTYFKNHPSCIPNTNCQKQYYPCSISCHAPTSEELSSSNTQCTDSDGGISYDKIGTVKYADGGSNTDLCIKQNPDGTFGDIATEAPYLIEYSCPTANNRGKIEYKCPNGCKDGACLPPFKGCRGIATGVCVEKVGGTNSTYFKNHPLCTPNTNCQGQYYACSNSCPTPTANELG